MKRTAAIGAAGAAVVLSLAAWRVQSNADDRKANVTFDLRQTAEHVVDQAPAGDSAGDTAVLAGDLLRGGEKAGQYQGYCVYITSGAHSQCSFTLALPDGQIVLSTGYAHSTGSRCLRVIPSSAAAAPTPRPAVTPRGPRATKGGFGTSCTSRSEEQARRTPQDVLSSGDHVRGSGVSRMPINQHRSICMKSIKKVTALIGSAIALTLLTAGPASALSERSRPQSFVLYGTGSTFDHPISVFAAGPILAWIHRSA